MHNTGLNTTPGNVQYVDVHNCDVPEAQTCPGVGGRQQSNVVVPVGEKCPKTETVCGTTLKNKMSVKRLVMELEEAHEKGKW